MDRKGNEVMSSAYVLNEEGRRQVLEFVRKHGNTRTVEGIEDSIDARDAWFADVDCGDNCLGHFEMPGYYTKTGNPTTTTFGPECFKDVDTLA